jgi:hypothetical protein
MARIKTFPSVKSVKSVVKILSRKEEVDREKQESDFGRNPRSDVPCIWAAPKHGPAGVGDEL